MATQINVRLDDATEIELRELQQHYAKGLTLATVRTSDIVRDLIHQEHARLIAKPTSRHHRAGAAT